jgi:hypothetical protein
MLLNPYQCHKLPLKLLKGIIGMRLDLNLFHGDQLAIVGALIDLTRTSTANDLRELDFGEFDNNIGGFYEFPQFIVFHVFADFVF